MKNNGFYEKWSKAFLGFLSTALLVFIGVACAKYIVGEDYQVAIFLLLIFTAIYSFFDVRNSK